MMGLLRILLTGIPRESLARQYEQTATCAAASLYQETVRFCGLMALMFYSNRSGHDDAADPFRKKPKPPV
jgi:hypothetical protein